MAALDFNKALDVKASEVKAVPVPPVGHYIWQITGVGEINNENDKWWMVNVPVVGVQPFEDADDVDQEALKEYGKISSFRTRMTWMLEKGVATETDMISLQNRIKRFMVDHVKVEGGEDMTLRELLSACKNKRFVGQLTHKADKRDAETMNANITRTAPIDG